MSSRVRVWQNWSAFGKPDISICSTDVSDETAHLNYDTWGVALAAQYAFADGWRLRRLSGVEGRAFAQAAF